MSIESLEHLVRSRFRTFLRHTWLVGILGGIVLAAVVSAALYFVTEATVMRIAAGPAGSANAKFVDVLGKMLAKSHDRIDLEIVPTDNATASAQAISSGKADLAIVPTTVGNSPDWPVVAILRQNAVALIVPAPPPPPPAPPATPAAAAPPAAPPTAAAPAAPAPATKAKTAKTASKTKSKKGGNAKTASGGKGGKSTKTAKASDQSSDDDSDDDSDDSSDTGKSSDSKKSDASNKLKKVPQIAGKRVGIVTGSEATPALLNTLLTHYGVPPDKVQVSQIDPKDVADAVHNNTVDVLLVAGAATGKAISDTVAAATQNGVAPSFIEIDQGDGIAARNGAFASDSIDAGTFGGSPPTPADDLKSLSFAEYLVARKSLSHSTIADLAKSIYTSRLALAAQMPGEIKIEAPSTDKDGAVLVHPGTLDYLNDNQQDFFDKYGNDIFYGMLIFPVFGSAIAGVASYLRRDSRTRRLRLLQRVLDLVRKAHAAQSVEALEQLQLDADDLVVAIVHLSEHEEFDESVRMSFAFALDQLRFAIAARRTAILDHSGASKAAAA